MTQSIIFENKDAVSFMKKLIDINQIMKNIYRDETNYEPKYMIYISDEGEILLVNYYDREALPSFLSFKSNEYYSNDNFHYRKYEEDFHFKFEINSMKFFNFCKNNKKDDITKITIEKDSLTIRSDTNKTTFVIYPNGQYIDDINAFIHKYLICETALNKNGVDPAIMNGTMSEENLKFIIDSPKLTKFYIDFNKESIIREDEVEDFGETVPFFLNKKFLNGKYYTVKHLKKGDVVESSKITFDLFTTDIENFYTVILNVKSKIGTFEHIFMISDF